jgi:class 3 adenylate cyclase/tetratricopeptide (TPR) repeat protein
MKTCSSCGEENPDRFRLCGFCGTPLPEAVTSAPPEETRKTVSIVFCDLVGSTNLAEQLDTESLREVLSLYFSEMRACLERHGGTVEKYIGDAIVTVFGLPNSHEDDALRAVRAAADMRDVLAGVNERIEARWGVRLTCRTGVNTGEVVATGDVDAREHLVAGDAVNTAARLEQAAPPNEILIGEPTYELVRDAADVERMEPLELKGKSERVPAYRLIRVKGSDGVARRQDAPMVGRAEELATLDRVLTEAIAQRECRLVTVIAPAGTGKSRLLMEFVTRWAGRARLLRGRCLSYGDGITFWPLAEIARQAADISDDDSLQEARRKLASLVGEENRDVAARLAGAIGLSDDPFTVEETFWAARRFLEILTREEPLIVVIDDIHWAEQTFLDLIGYVLQTTTDAPLVVVCSARRDLLEDHPGWTEERAGATNLILLPLSDEQSAQVVSNLLGSSNLEPALAAKVVAQAEGNPLFVEQLLGMLTDEGLLVQSSDGRWAATSDLGHIKLPPTVAALLAARLDRLPLAERGVVERAAVVGQVFFQGAVEDLSPEPLKAQVAPSLGGLSRKELIRPTEAAFAEEPTFRFGHILIQDVAYRGVLKRTRADLHERFVNWLERAWPDRVVEYEEIRGHHLEQAYLILAELGPIDDHGRLVGVRGAGYLSSAGHRALARGDMHAASSLLRRSAGLLPEDDRGRAHLLLEAGEALTELGEFELADATLRLAQTQATRIGDRGVIITTSLALVYLHYVTAAVGGEAAVMDEAELAVPQLEALGDHRGLARAWRLLTYVHGTACRWGAAEAAAKTALAHATLAQEHRLVMGIIASLASCALYGPTPVPEAILECEKLLEGAQGDRKAEATILWTMSHLEAMRGSFDRARDLYGRSRAMLEELGWKVRAALTSLVSGPVEMLAGEPAAAESELRRDYAALEVMGERNYISTTAGFLAEAHFQQGKMDVAESFVLQCRELAAPDDVVTQVLWRTVQAKILSKRGVRIEAERLARQAVDLIETTDEPDSRGSALLALAEVLLAAEKEEEAVAAAARAATSFEAKGNVVDSARARLLIERLHATAST